MKKYLLYKIKEKNAQALPEFAICLPLMLLIIGMIVTVGQMTYAKQVLQSAAEVGCRTYVDGELSSTNATNLAKKNALEVVNAAGFGIELVDATAKKEVLTTQTGNATSFYVATYKVTGKFATLFPLSWDNKVIVDPDGYTYLFGTLSMLIER